ncbi:hypothetical protein Q8A67_006346 [Cirrhinus molitorella]|uniref:SET domain-containing protein n=1 Tax=Cirrhinus molitorella TaxID=172907 RepID=A0AA88U308_9TELE|nr:hypothetical protein Q8A67_006346 [Cirrhinus molitorella]
MVEQHQKRSADRNIVHCLQCHKPQESLPVHLARVCMKKSTPEERADEVQKARASSREWIRKNRTWNYKQLCELLPDRRSRIAMVKELLRRGFFIMNQPEESDMVLDPEGDSVTVETDTIATTATTNGDPQNISPSVRMKMKKAGLHKKFPAQAKLLVGFKKYLTVSRRVPNWQQEVDNVSRFLRYVQPTKSEPSLDFLSKTTETQDFLTALQRADLCAATVLYYIKSIKRFLEYLTARLDLQRRDPQLRTNCQSYTDMLTSLRKRLNKTHNDKTCDTRLFANDAPCIKDCQMILRVAKPDFLRIHGDLLMGKEVTNTEKTLYRYYCEALLVFRHMQRPGAVEGFTIKPAKTILNQIKLIKPAKTTVNHFKPAKIQIKPVFKQTHYTSPLGPFRSHDLRRAVWKAAQKLPSHQQEAINHYLAHNAGVDQQQDRKTQPQDIVDAAMLLDSLEGCSHSSFFIYFVPCFLTYTALLQGQSHFVARLIAKEAWKANYPKPEEIERLWKPAPTGTIETDEVIIKCVSEQTWTGLAIKDFGAEEGLGVVATRPFSKGDIVCDYHGKVIRAAEGMAMMKGRRDEAKYLFFFKAGQRDLCIDAQTGCDCHPNTDTVGRRIKYCYKRPNLEPLHSVLKVNGEDEDVILFKALQDISIDTQLKFFSGVIRRSFLGLDLDWLDE